MHYKSGFGQRYRGPASPTSEFKNRPRYISKPLKQKALIRAGLCPACTRHNIIDLHVETWLSVKGLRHKKALLPNADRPHGNYFMGSFDERGNKVR
jgi:hypothetical protein